MSHIPLAVTQRNGRTEAVHCGSVAVVDAGGMVLSIGEPHAPTYLRSSCKMLQALPVVESGAARRFGLSDAQIAVCCASHSGADYHLAAVAGLLRKIGLEPEALQCGAHPPADRAEGERLARSGEAPTALHNNCSGKHAGMLAACRALDWPIESYLDPQHPLQQWILRTIADYTGQERDAIGLGTDGCSLPTFHVPLSGAARALGRFMLEAKNSDSPAHRILTAVAAHPEMVYQHGGFDTELMRVLRGRCMAKRGAMGIFVVGLHTPRHGTLGVAVKIDDGAIAILPVVVMRVLEQLEILTPDELRALEEFRTLPVRNCNGILTGETVACFPVNQT